MKAIKNLIITLVVIVAILGVVIIGGYVAVRSQDGIHPFRTPGQRKTLQKDVDQYPLFPKAHSAKEFFENKRAVNYKIDRLIVQ